MPGPPQLILSLMTSVRQHSGLPVAWQRAAFSCCGRSVPAGELMMILACWLSQRAVWWLCLLHPSMPLC